MWATFTVDSMDYVSAQWFLPLGLLIDYSLFVYLLVVYWTRRREPRVALLLSVGLLSAVILVPYARATHEKVTHLNDISESCGILTFLIQVTIVGRDLNKKIKFRNVLYATYVAEAIITVSFITLLLAFADELNDAFLPDAIEQDVLEVLDNASLVFVFCFRFYCVAAANGWRDILKNRRTELVVYVLFATCQLPFLLLELVSELSWDAPMALYNRLTIAACLVVVTRAKIRKDSSAGPSRPTTYAAEGGGVNMRTVLMHGSQPSYLPKSGGISSKLTASRASVATKVTVHAG